MKGIQNRFYHINSYGQNVIFRDEDDFIQILNDLPIASFKTNTLLLAFNVLSTHFHLCVITENADEFIKTIKLSYTRYFQNKYHIKGKVLDIEACEKTDFRQKINTLHYILKNAVHHEIVFSPFQYPYSSIDCYFKNKLSRLERFSGEYETMKLIHPSDLKGREKRTVLRKCELSDAYQIKDRILIAPESYINSKIVEGFYRNNYKNFLVEMNRNAADNTSLENKGKRFVTTESLMISSQRISDIEVCKVINDYVGIFHRSTFVELSTSESLQICQLLNHLGASNLQIKRCLWQ